MYDVQLVDVAFAHQRPETWEFRDRFVRGRAYLYEICDWNFSSRRDWEFVVRVPDKWKDDYIEVRPTRVPGRRVWAELERRSLQFARATIGRHRAKAYAKMAIADVEGKKNKRVLNADDRGSLLPSLKLFHPVVKEKVTTTKGTDGKSLVAVFDREDHGQMIRLFLALKPWVLYTKHSRADARRAAAEARRRAQHARKRRPLAEERVVVAGLLGRGSQREVVAWLRNLGAVPQANVTRDTTLVIVGAHHGVGRCTQIQRAKDLETPRLCEAEFRQKYSV